MEMTGMLGTSLAAAELTQQGFVVSMTSRNARDADVLVAHQDDKRAWSIQMKMNPASFWLLSKDDRKVSSATHIYLFVNLRGRQTGLRRCAEPRRGEMPSDTKTYGRSSIGEPGSISQRHLKSFSGIWLSTMKWASIALFVCPPAKMTRAIR